MIAAYSIPSTDYYKDLETFALDYATGGFARSLTNPLMLHFNGSTYSVGYKNNTYNNQVWILKQTGSSVISNTVNEGTDGSEPLNHPTPLSFIDESTGYIYVIQNEFHVDRFKVWKSSNPEDISSWDFIGYFGTNESYLGLIDYNGIDCFFQTRSADAGSSADYNQSIIEVNLDTPSGYTETQLTDANYSVTNVRHYPCEGWSYGTSDYVVVGINKRKDGAVKYYCTQLLIAEKSNLNVWYNEDLSFSKNISVDGLISNTELDTEYNVVGNPADNTITITEVRMIRVNDDIYIIYLSDEATNTYTVRKSTIGIGQVASYELPVTDIFDDGVQLDNYSAMFYNGSSIIVRLKRELVTSLYRLDLACTSLTYLQDVDTPDGLYLGLPANFDQIPRNQRYMMVGRSIIGANGEIPYTITNRKFK